MAVTKLTKDNFDLVKNSDKTVLIDFYAAWCNPCKMLAPVVEKLAEQYEGKATVGKVDIDEERALAMRYRVMSIPTVLVFKNGELVTGCVGLRPKSELLALLA